MIDPAQSECPHGDPRPERCALCRRARRRASEQARFKAALAARPDVAKLAAGDRDEEEPPALW